MMHSIVRTFILLVMSATCLAGEPPRPFQLTYSASYSGLRADSSRSLQIQEDGSYRMEAETVLRLLGAEVSKIRESSIFAWSGDLPLPRSYAFVQSGLGSRERTLEFDQQAATVAWQVDDMAGILPMETPLYDDLSSFLVLRTLLSSGSEELFFDVAEKDAIKNYHYHLIDREALQTEIGTFDAVHLERIREGDSERHTEFWLAENHDYILLKFVQTEPDEKEIRLEITAATIDGAPLTPLTDPREN
jgi:hypothetical protein